MTTHTKFGQFRDVRIPPESTGPRIHNLVRYDLEMTSVTGTPGVGDLFTTSVTSMSGTVIFVRQGSVGGQWFISVSLDEDSPLEFEINETLLFNSGGDGTVVQADRVYTTATTLVGGTTPFNSQEIDDRGSAYFRFTEGSQQLDAFGLSRFTSPTLMTEYIFKYGVDQDRFTFQDAGSGNETHLPNESSLRLQVGTDTGALARKTSDMYHPYQAGFGQLIVMTATMGDSGKTGVRRQWGYFDDEDGLYFQLDGTTASVVVRDSTSGTVTETVIPQSEWNSDIANGQGGIRNISNFNIDFSKNNIYWIDLEWLGAGRVRFGVFSSEGERIVLHTVQNANNHSRPYMKTASLPVRFCIENTAVTVSTSEMKVTCVAVHTDGNVIDDRRRRTVKRAYDSINNIIPDTETPIFAVRASDIVGGVVNRQTVIPEIFTIRVVDQPILLRFHKDVTVTGGTWFKPQTDSALEVNDDPTAISGGIHMLSWFLEPGSYVFDMPENFGMQGENIHLLADGSYGIEWVFTAQSLTSAQDANVSLSLSWIDIGG